MAKDTKTFAKQNFSRDYALGFFLASIFMSVFLTFIDVDVITIAEYTVM